MRFFRRGTGEGKERESVRFKLVKERKPRIENVTKCYKWNGAWNSLRKEEETRRHNYQNVRQSPQWVK